MKNQQTYFLTSSILAFVIVCIVELFGLVNVAMPMLGVKVALAFVFCSLLLHFYFMSKNTQVDNVTQILASILRYGLIAYSIAMIPDILELMTKSETFARLAPLLKVIDLISFFLIVAYFLFTLTFFKKLIFVKANESVITLWKTFVWILGISSLNLLVPTIAQGYVGYVLLGAGALVSIGLLCRLKWIAFINQKAKWSSLLLLALTTLILGVLFQKLFQIQAPILVLDPILQNTFLILVSGVVSLYSLIAFLGIAFNLPITSVMEERDSEVIAFQQISRSILNNDKPLRTFNILFKNCYRSSNADAGALLYLEKGSNELVVYPTSDEENIQFLDQRLSIIEMIENEKDKSEFYLGNLVKKGIVKSGEFPYQSLLLFPIRNKTEQLRGVIILLRSMAGGFDEYIIKRVKNYVEQAQVSFEMTDLVEENIKSIRVKEELDLARKVQTSLIPTENPITEHFELSGFSAPAHEVGGDYYDFSFNEESLEVIIGDVAGSGSSAAFYMAELRGIFQSMNQLNLPMTQFIEVTNRAVSKSLKRNLFTAICLMKLDFKTNNLRYCRAGHTPVLFFDSIVGRAKYFEDKGMGLGILRDDEYKNHIHVYDKKVQSGDVIVLFTDGITETKNSNNELYGQERLLNELERMHEHTADDIKNALQIDCQKFSEETEYQDDTTLVVVKIK